MKKIVKWEKLDYPKNAKIRLVKCTNCSHTWYELIWPDKDIHEDKKCACDGK